MIKNTFYYLIIKYPANVQFFLIQNEKNDIFFRFFSHCRLLQMQSTAKQGDAKTTAAQGGGDFFYFIFCFSTFFYQQIYNFKKKCTFAV